MIKKISLWVFLVGSIALVSGCATGRNYQSDIDALNSKISALEGQLSAKDQEIARLQNQTTQQQAALSQAEAEKRTLSEKLHQAASQLESKKAAKSQESDLK